MRRLITIALGLLIAGLWITGHAVTSAQPGIAAPPPPGGMYIQVPRAGGYVWIPLDAAGNPQVPGASPSTGQDMGPSAPAVPPAPSAPGVPSQPTPGSWGFLQAEVLPADAQISIDGRGVGTAQQQFVALAPGLHRVEASLPGFKPARVTVEIVAMKTYVLQLRLTADPSGSSTSSRGDNYESLTSDIPAGGGYIIVPRR